MFANMCCTKIKISFKKLKCYECCVHAVCTLGLRHEQAAATLKFLCAERTLLEHCMDAVRILHVCCNWQLWNFGAYILTFSLV